MTLWFKLKINIQFQNSILDCDKVESNSSLFLKPVLIVWIFEWILNRIIILTEKVCCTSGGLIFFETCLDSSPQYLDLTFTYGSRYNASQHQNKQSEFWKHNSVDWHIGLRHLSLKSKHHVLAGIWCISSLSISSFLTFLSSRVAKRCEI